MAEASLRDLEALLDEKSEKKELPLSAPAEKTDFLPAKKPTLHRTAYLDGLRGFAALLVFSLHHQVWGHSGMMGELIIENAFGYHSKYYLIAFPGLRLLFSGGHLAVSVFFVISGYVLSAKPLSYIQARETMKMSSNIASSLIRRWLRLYVPVIATTFVWMTSWHIFGIKSSNPIARAPESNWFDELWMWYCDFKNYSFLFQNDPVNSYNDHSWSIPLEFRGSIVIYTCVLAFSECSTNARLLSQVGLLYYFLYIVDGWYCALFIAGMLLCDLDLLSLRNELPPFLQRLKSTKSWIFYVLFFIGLYLGGVPTITEDLPHLRDSPGWYILSFFKPQAFWDFRKFYQAIAAICLVASIPHISLVKKFFEAPFCQYLGKVSFTFYLVHGPVLWTLGDRFYAAAGRLRAGHIGVVPGWINLVPLPGYGPFGLEINYLVPMLILLGFTLWLAELGTKFIDEPSVKFAQWVQSKLKREDDSLDRSFKFAH
ncbi:hypothetical protein K461DRAFT_224487 [Myriangium duriaei CBS 260.36]|uniref:Acyltransferase 3 domain-containing protein n=1 Tax=Myriangium duriaei CBS 260.36 TaxID=1168546 RepID=A0A9P4J1U0_9PEZI|nr:hypothetical protein K461DRAFT_224487 [Myriangium duriaei CBS 260.36]